MECGENTSHENTFGFSEEDEPLVIVDNVPQVRKPDSFLIENLCDTVLSSESLCLDWEQPPSSSGSTEPIQDGFKDMGIDNACWYDDDNTECPTASLPPSNDPFSALAGPVATRTDSCAEGGEDAELPADPSLVSTPNNQLVLYKPPEEESSKGRRKNFFVQLHPSKKIYIKPERKKAEVASETSSDENVMAGCCGLRNLGNTCFMSAGIQCLSATPPLVKFFLLEKARLMNSHSNTNEEASCSNGVASKNDCSHNLTHDFARLLSEMWGGKFNSISPHYFKRSLSVMHPQFKDYRQHDCQEFLTLLLDSLHEQLNDSNKADGEYDRNRGSDSEEAVAGCSQENLDPGRSSNTDLAFLLASGKNGLVEKNCLEQNLCPSPPVPPTSPNMSPNQDFSDSSFSNHMDQNYISRSLLGMDMTDLLKDAKTPNINVLAPQHCEPKPNNLIKYDSEKFSPTSRKMPSSSNSTTRSVRNLTGVRNGSDMALGDDHNGLLGEVSQKDSGEDIPLLNGKRLKQTNLLNGLSMHFDGELDDGASSNTNKRLKLVSQTKLNGDRGDVEMMDSEEENSSDRREEMEADSFWQKHLEANRSIVVDSFQGQFKSTVICDVCNHISVTYEPFMYLSVPLPHALERQICVIYLPADMSQPPMRVLLTMKKSDNLKALQDELIKVAELPSETNIAICEVLDNHIGRVLEAGLQLRNLNEHRLIYAVETLPAPVTSIPSPTRLSPIPCLDLPFCDDDDLAQPIDLRPNAGLDAGIITVPTEAEVNREASASPSKSSQWPTCSICLEESDMKTQLKTHEACGCIVCINCLDIWLTKENGDLRCPQCRIEIKPEIDLTTFKASDKKIIRIMQITVVFRLDVLGEECSNNKKSLRLIGHPRLVKLPSVLSGKVLYETLQQLAPHLEFQVLLVAGKGMYCSRCLYNKHCIGCVLSPDSPEVILHPDDALAIRLMGPLDPAMEMSLPFSSPPVDHKSMKLPRWNDPLTIHDCLQAFSESEQLDKENPWYCPKCRTNQCATKTLTVWRYPDILIIYLKRFVFNERSISKLDNKVTFPLNGLRLDTPGSKSRVNIFNLYSVVCHFGGASAGHYTAFAKHPRTNEWFNYNDETTIKKTPQEEDYSNGYILFYQRENQPDLFA